MYESKYLSVNRFLNVMAKTSPYLKVSATGCALSVGLALNAKCCMSVIFTQWRILS